MRMKLIIALVSGEQTDDVIEAGRAGGATGETVITSVRGEGLKPHNTFFGLDLTAQRDLILFLVAASRARPILEAIRDAVGFDTESGAGIAFQIDIEDVVGLNTQLPAIISELEEDI